MDHARASESAEVVESLLRYFLTEVHDREAFTLCLSTCYDLIRPDVALEMSWKEKALDECMPYLLRSMRDLTSKVDSLGKAVEKLTAKADTTAHGRGGELDAPFLALNRNLALTNPQEPWQMR
jgi:clathrin heavy chain